MKRIGKPLAWAAVAGTVLIVFVLYQVKNNTRALDRRVGQLERRLEAVRSDVAILEAEWSNVTQPEWIDRLSRKYLGLRPTRPRQYVTSEQLPPLRKARR